MFEESSTLLDFIISNPNLAGSIRQLGFIDGLEMALSQKQVEEMVELLGDDGHANIQLPQAGIVSEEAIMRQTLTPLNLNRMSVVWKGNEKADFDYATPLNLGNGKQLLVKPGVSLVIGKAGTGKTLLTETVIERLNSEVVDRITFAEPDYYTELNEAKLMLKILGSQKRIVVIDSLRRAFFGTSGGSTGKGGVNNTIFMVLSAWDAIGKATNRHFMIVMNPSSDDDSEIARYIEVAKGSVTIVMHTVAPGIVTMTARYISGRDHVDLTYSTSALSRTEDRSAAKKDATTQRVEQTPIRSEFADLYITKPSVGE